MGAGERMDAPAEAGHEIGRAGRTAERLVGDRLDGGERVLDPVVQLLEQEALEGRGLLPLGDVAGDLGRSHHLSRAVVERRDRDREVDPAAVLGDPHRLEMVDPLAAAELREDLVLLGVKLGRDEAQDRRADHLIGPVAEDPGRAGIPRGDPALEVLADDRVVGAFDDRRQPGRLDIALRLGVGIDEHVDRTGDGPGRVAEQRGVGDEGDAGPVRPLEDRGAAAHRLALLEGQRHRALVMGHRPAVEPTQPPRIAPAAARLRVLAPELGRGGIVEDDPTLGVGHIDRNGKSLEKLKVTRHNCQGSDVQGTGVANAPVAFRFHTSSTIIRPDPHPERAGSRTSPGLLGRKTGTPDPVRRQRHIVGAIERRFLRTAFVEPVPAAVIVGERHLGEPRVPVARRGRHATAEADAEGKQGRKSEERHERFPVTRRPALSGAGTIPSRRPQGISRPVARFTADGANRA